MAGAVISLVAIFSIANFFDSVSVPAFYESEEWINLQMHLVVGGVVVIIGAVELWMMPHHPT